MAPKKAASPAKAAPAKAATTPAKAKPKPKSEGAAAPEDAQPAEPSTSSQPPAEQPAAAVPAATAVPTGAEAGPPPPADSLEGVLAALDFEGLPGRENFERNIVQELKAQSSQLMASFVLYAKASSECATVEAATRLSLTGLRKLSAHAGLESAVLPVDNIIRIFGRCANGGEMPASSKEVAPTTTLDLRGYFSMVVHLAFYRQNPRYGAFGAQKEKKEGSETVSVSGAMKSFVNEVLPRLHKNSSSFASMLSADRAAQQVLTQYQPQLEAWRSKLVSDAEASHDGDVS